LFTSHNVSNKCNWLPYINPFFHLDITGVSWTIKTTSDNDWTFHVKRNFERGGHVQLSLIQYTSG